ncbi:hypothetical protein [Pseudonocardia phyllosphaerae]|uniref:hypothetical protein n=1 Tax=Pseudonocardia phyllosphaerae TaxID=3390502 RepID=UPI00397DCC28
MSKYDKLREEREHGDEHRQVDRDERYGESADLTDGQLHEAETDARRERRAEEHREEDREVREFGD